MAGPGDGFTITRLRSGDIVRVSVVGALDIATAPLLRKQFECEKQEDIDAALLVDLRKLDFMDSCGLHLLEWAYSVHGERLRISLGTAAARLVDAVALRDKLPIVDG